MIQYELFWECSLLDILVYNFLLKQIPYEYGIRTIAANLRPD